MIIGLYLRHIKVYGGIKFIPVGYKWKFSSYIGKNGIGKSSILEGFDCFFNNKFYNINKNATSGIRNRPFFVPIFLIKKSEISFHQNDKDNVDRINDYFWSVERILGSADIKDFINIREDLKSKGFNKEEYYLFIIGEQLDLKGSPKISFGSFTTSQEFLQKMLNDTNITIKTDTEDSVFEKYILKLDDIFSKVLQTIKSHYSYIYFPVELNIENFTKIETIEMQKVFGKKLKSEIETMLSSIKLDGKDGINTKLNEYIMDIEKSLNSKYTYKTGQQRNNNITKNDITNKIIESYFQKRILYMSEKKASELSAGEKRQALIEIVSAFLLKEDRSDFTTIIGIDEPENSLHTSACYEQFDKLSKVSKKCQMFITTHWYGFLPILDEGYGHFLTDKEVKNKKEIIFDTYDLYDYKTKIKRDMQNTNNEIPHDFSLKSTNDLVQAIYYSLYSDKPYNWLIVEGISEKIYFEYFFKNEIENNLRILPLGGNSKVSEIYEFLELPLKKIANSPKGKVFCLIDTDEFRHKEYIGDGNKILQIRRLCNENDTKTSLLTLKHSTTTQTDIEQSLNPIVFKETIQKLMPDNYNIDIKNQSGNTSFVKNLRCLELEEYFNENEGGNKITFAKKYIEISKNKFNQEIYIPDWIKEIKVFFEKK